MRKLLALAPDAKLKRTACRPASWKRSAVDGSTASAERWPRRSTTIKRSLGKSDLALGLRLGKTEAINEALKVVADETADKPTRLAYVEILGQTKRPEAVAVLLRRARRRRRRIR